MTTFVSERNPSLASQFLKTFRSLFVLFFLLSCLVFLVFFDLGLFSSFFSEVFEFPLKSTLHMFIFLWTYLWFMVVIFAPVALFVLLAEREIRSVKVRFGRSEGGMLAFIKWSATGLSLILLIAIFFACILLSLQSLEARFGPRALLSRVSFEFVNAFDGYVRRAEDWLFDSEQKRLSGSRLAVFVPTGFLTSDSGAVNWSIRGFHSQEVLLNARGPGETIASYLGSKSSGSHMRDALEVFGLGAELPLTVQAGSGGSSGLNLGGGCQGCIVLSSFDAEARSFGQGVLGVLFRMQPQLLGFLRLASHVPVLRSVLPEVSWFVKDDVLLLEKVIRELGSVSGAERVDFVVALHEGLSFVDAEESLAGAVGFTSYDRNSSVFLRRRERTWSLVKKLVERFSFDETVILPFPEAADGAVFSRMLANKLPVLGQLGSEQSAVLDFVEVNFQQAISFSKTESCHFIAMPRRSSLLRRLERVNRPFVSLWCATGEKEDPIVFVFSDPLVTSDWLSLNSSGVVPAVAFPIGPQVQGARRPVRKGGQGANLSGGGLARIEDEHFWSDMPGLLFRVKSSARDLAGSMLVPISKEDGVHVQILLREHLRKLNPTERSRLGSQLSVLLGAP